MRRKNLSGILALLLGAVLLWGCTGEENPVEPETGNGEKKSVSLNVEFKLSGREIADVRGISDAGIEGSGGSSTKAEVDEQLVEDVNVYMVDGVGDLVHHGYYRSIVNLQVE
ncbi:MAG: hypothetical protein IKB48_03085, partial [Bacteroidales bacterium]|nr:hypothetical protein [Bacteroidales bacterium]